MLVVSTALAVIALIGFYLLNVRHLHDVSRNGGVDRITRAQASTFHEPASQPKPNDNGQPAKDAATGS